MRFDHGDFESTQSKIIVIEWFDFNARLAREKHLIAPWRARKAKLASHDPPSWRNGNELWGATSGVRQYWAVCDHA